MILAELYGEITVTASAPRLAGTLSVVESDPPTAPWGSLSGDTTLPPAIKPGSLGGEPWIGFEVSWNGAALLPGDVRAPISVALYRSQPAAWSFSLLLGNAFPSPLAALGAVGGGRGRLDMAGLYVTSSGLHRAPLVANGSVLRSSSRQEQDGNRVVDLSGTDALAHFIRRRVDKNFPAGHGTDAGGVVTLIANAAGMATRPLVLGAMKKPLAVLNAEWLPPVQQVLAVHQRTCRVDPDGVLEFPPVGFDPGQPVFLTISDADIVAGSVQVSGSSDVPTRIKITGTEVGDKADVAEQTITDPPIITKALYAPKTAAYRQGSTGTLVASGLTPTTPDLIEVSRVERVRQMRGSTPLAERIAEWGWINPRVSRYRMNADGTRQFDPCYLYAGAAEGDSAEGYLAGREVYAVIRLTQTVWTYDADGYLVDTVTTKVEPRVRRAALKVRPNTSTPFESVNFIAGRGTLGDGTGVTDSPYFGFAAGEYLPSDPQFLSGEFSDPSSSPSSRTTTAYDVFKVTTMGVTIGFEAGNEARTEEWAALDGDLYLWHDGAKGEEKESFRETTVVTTKNVATPGQNVYNQVVSTSVLGQEVQTVISPAQDSFLPAAQKDTSGTAPPPATTFEGTWIAWALEGSHEQSEVVAAEALVENAAQAQALARSRTIEGSAVSVSFTCLPLFGLPPWARVRVTGELVPSVVAEFLGVPIPQAVDIFLEAVVHTQGVDDHVLTSVSGNWYPYLGT